MAEATLHHVARARSPRGALALACTWGAAVLIQVFFQALPFITLLLVLAGAPLAYDILRDRQNWFVVDRDTVSWGGAEAHDEVLLSAIEQVHLTFRLDLSAKLGLRLRDGRLIHPPLATLPGPHTLERVFTDLGIKVIRGRQPLG